MCIYNIRLRVRNIKLYQENHLKILYIYQNEITNYIWVIHQKARNRNKKQKHNDCTAEHKNKMAAIIINDTKNCTKCVI